MSTMQPGLADFVAARNDLEQRLRTLITTEVDAFHELTGATVDSISVNICTMHRPGMPAGRLVSSVKVGTPLD